VGSRLQVLLTRFDDAIHPSVQVERRRSNLTITHVGDRKRKTVVGSTSTDASAAHTPASAHRKWAMAVSVTLEGGEVGLCWKRSRWAGT
jgi:cation transport regulator ChaC